MNQIWYRIILFILVVGCDNNDDSVMECKESGNCDKCAVINRKLYNQTTTDHYGIQNITVDQDCLEIEFGSSGCDGKSWEIDLVDLGSISETAITQRDLKLKLINSEDCEAFIIRTISFNINPLQLYNIKKADYKDLISYEY